MLKQRLELSLDSTIKTFTFNASSFALNPSVESFLKSKGAIAIDLGTAAYINSEAMPVILLELVDRSSKTDSPPDTDLVAQLKAENLRLQMALKSAQAAIHTGQRDEKLQKQFQQLQSQSAEAITSLKVLEEENDELREEIERLRNQLAKSAPSPKAA